LLPGTKAGANQAGPAPCFSTPFSQYTARSHVAAEASFSKTWASAVALAQNRKVTHRQMMLLIIKKVVGGGVLEDFGI
jgi:hypothetical protein